MEPRQYKLLSEILLGLGALCAAIGVALLYLLDDNLPGALCLIAGCAMALISLPTFMILTLITGMGINEKKN